MKAREPVRLSALRMVEGRADERRGIERARLDEGEAQQVLASLIKQRRDSIEQFGKPPVGRIWSTRRPRKSRCSRSTRRRRSAGGARARRRRRDRGNRRHVAQGHGTCDEGCDGRARRARASTARPSTSWSGKSSRAELLQTFSSGLRLIILKGNAQASHPSSMGPPSKGGGLFLMAATPYPAQATSLAPRC